MPAAPAIVDARAHFEIQRSPARRLSDSESPLLPGRRRLLMTPGSITGRGSGSRQCVGPRRRAQVGAKIFIAAPFFISRVMLAFYAAARLK